MSRSIHDTSETLRRLDALQASGVLTQAETVSCASLADALLRPARVAVLGQSADDIAALMRSLTDETFVNLAPGGPAMELRHGPAPVHVATFEDGSSLTQDGYPDDGLLRYGPVFLEVEAPVDILSTMSFLAVELGMETEDCGRALAWASKRSEIAIFCAETFGDTEEAIWASAPERLKNHCYLVVTGERDANPARARRHFDAVIHAPGGSGGAPLGALQHRLATDIAAARQEDIDAAELFLHRFRRAAEAARLAASSASKADDAAAGAPPSAGPDRAVRSETPEAGSSKAKVEGAEAAAGAAAGQRDGARAAARELVSAPILHLKRRSRALAELLEWREEDENWSSEVLEHCFETAEALRDLVAAWPDDDPVACRLRDAIDQACDTVVLLQVESGPDQAEDAARVLFQLRTDFEQEMAA